MTPPKTWLPYPATILNPHEPFDDTKGLIKGIQERVQSLLAIKTDLNHLEDVVPGQHHPQVSENLELLISGKAVAVITGQQPCLYGGPALVLHKIATTLSICSWLKEQDILAVPMFWNASEDHDLPEMLQVTGTHPDWQLNQYRQKFSHLQSAETLDASNTRSWPSQISPWLKKTFELNNLDWGRQFSTALTELFKDHGLLVVEPRDFRDSSHDFWDRVEVQQSQLVDSYQQQEQLLIEKGLAIQAPRRHPLPIFHLNPENGERTALGATPFQFQPMQDAQPSPGALLRPIFAQSQLPIAISVLGPSEYLYHQQTPKAFACLGYDFPLLWPRLSGTWIPRGLKDQLSQWNLYPESFIPEQRALKELLWRHQAEPEGKMFAEHLKSLYTTAQAQYPEDLGALEQLEKDLFKALGRFDKNLQRHHLRQLGLPPRQIHRWQEFFYPKGGLQERSLGWAFYLENAPQLEAIVENFKNPLDFSHRFYH